jgi:hypothetical protein
MAAVWLWLDHDLPFEANKPPPYRLMLTFSMYPGSGQQMGRLTLTDTTSFFGRECRARSASEILASRMYLETLLGATPDARLFGMITFDFRKKSHGRHLTWPHPRSRW